MRIVAGGVTGLLLTSVLSMSGCDDTTGPDDADFEGVSLTFEGAPLWATHQSPSFTDGQIDEGPFTAAFPDSVGGWVVAGFLPTEAPKGDLFILQLTERRTGAFEPCGPDQECHGRLMEGIDPNDLQAGATSWEIVSGSVAVDEAAAGRMRGSLSNLVLQKADSDETRAATEGGFHVELLSDAEGVSIMQCFMERLTGGSCG